MSTKKGTTWPAEPHTIAKIAMLGSYLYQWFSILGTRFKGKNLWYIDGFAGPGEYTNHPHGSPIAALTAGETAMKDAGVRWVARDIHCIFIEESWPRVENLARIVAELPEHPRIHTHSVRGTFVQGFDWLAAQAVNPFQSADPVFAFIDPFGPSGLSFDKVRDLLSRPACEVLVNLDSDGVSRIYAAGDSANHRELLNNVFGDDTWETELAGAGHQAEAVRRVVALYKKKLRAIPDVNYVFSFEMRKKSDVLDYHLVFASQHPRGLEKMKEVMKKIDKTGAYCFSDDHVGQGTLFTFDDASEAAERMHDYFVGSVARYDQVNDYALNESPFPNPKSMLKFLESKDRIWVDSGGKPRRKGTFPDDLHDVIRIRF